MRGCDENQVSHNPDLCAYMTENVHNTHLHVITFNVTMHEPSSWRKTFYGEALIASIYNAYAYRYYCYWCCKDKLLTVPLWTISSDAYLSKREGPSLLCLAAVSTTITLHQKIVQQ